MQKKRLRLIIHLTYLWEKTHSFDCETVFSQTVAVGSVFCMLLCYSFLSSFSHVNCFLHLKFHETICQKVI